ncbi:hypothetical protein EPI10_001908 [Gossypium australe]|uniref:Uncharacterized protein n=1 Tax=Gossypium australe TaxID=47621 RepID=A0A5B6VCQ8_9ROSI|nr:hypothetical protein EPI10_001908 [Gossypium australe]
MILLEAICHTWIISRKRGWKHDASNPPYQPSHLQRSQERPMGNDHVGCGQRLDRIEGEMQLMRSDIQQVKS